MSHFVRVYTAMTLEGTCRNCVVHNRTKSLSCLSLATIQDGSGVTWTRLIKGFNWLASSLDILINLHISSLSFFGFAFRLTSLICCLFLGKTPCDWNPSKPPASSKLRRILEKAPFVLFLSLWCSAMYLEDTDSTNCYSSLHFHELLWWQGEAHHGIRVVYYVGN